MSNRHMQAKAESYVKGAAEAVERSRRGDQVATGIISKVAEQAKKGNPNARKAAAAIHHYIQKNPFGEDKQVVTMVGPIAVTAERKKRAITTASGLALGALVLGFPGAAVLGAIGYFVPDLLK